MIKFEWLSREKGLFKKAPVARGWAIFFYVTFWVTVFCAPTLFTSCTHTPAGPEKEILSTTERPGRESMSEDLATSEDAALSVNPERKGSEVLEAELEFEKAKNEILARENDRLRSELSELNLALAEANRTIYSLNRKLEAIFKPDIAGE